MNHVFRVLIDALVGLLFAIDEVVYGFIPILYRLLLYLSNVDLVTGNVPVQALIQRVYILVGVFMLFRLSFSILNYIINPDAFSDQSKGFSNLVKRILIAVVLLVGIPWIFKEAYVIQNKIITSGILPRLILGESIEYSDSSNNDELEASIETSAKDVQFMLFGPFFSINYDAKGEEDGQPGELDVCRPTPEYPTSNILGTKGMASNEACMNKMAELMDDPQFFTSSVVTKIVKNPSIISSYMSDFFRYEEDDGTIVDKRRFENFGGLLPLTLDSGDRVIKYYFIASTLCGGYLVFLLLSFCIDIGARVIRLFFLQILSPIAVISSVDPTSSGDRLKDWAKECVKVWASLFLRLLVIFLIIQLVRVISNSFYSGAIFSTGYSNSSALNAWIYVFLILGVFQAAKSIPDFIEKATGIKMSGDLQLNPFKAIGSNVGVGLIGGAALTGASLLAANGWGAFKRFKSLSNKLNEKEGVLSDIDNGLMENNQNYLRSGSALRYAIGDAIRNEKAAKNAETNAWNAYLQHPNSSILYNQLEQARADSRAATKARQDAQTALDSTRAEYQARKSELSSKRSEAQEDYDKQRKFMQGQVASSVAGIATGAVAGAVRGAIGGSKANTIKGIKEEIDRARMRTTERRNERDSFADMRHEGRYTNAQRVEGMIDQFSGVMGDKSYGPGQASDQLKSLAMSISDVQRRRSRTSELLAERQPTSISDDKLDRLVKAVETADENNKRNALNAAQTALQTFSSQTLPEFDAIKQYLGTYEQYIDYTDRLIDLEKQRGKLEDIKNIPGPPPGNK